MKDEIIRLLGKYSSLLSNNDFDGNVIYEDDFEDIAKEIENLYYKMHESITLNRTIVNKNTITLSEQDIDDLKRIRDYFGKNDNTVFSHFAFKVIDDILKKL